MFKKGILKSRNHIYNFTAANENNQIRWLFILSLLL